MFTQKTLKYIGAVKEADAYSNIVKLAQAAEALKVEPMRNSLYDLINKCNEMGRYYGTSADPKTKDYVKQVQMVREAAAEARDNLQLISTFMHMYP